MADINYLAIQKAELARIIEGHDTHHPSSDACYICYLIKNANFNFASKQQEEFFKRRSGEMANTEDWTIAPRRSGDKTIEFFGPGTLHLSLDFDDVDHKEVERALPQILSKLNSEPPIDIE